MSRRKRTAAGAALILTGVAGLTMATTSTSSAQPAAAAGVPTVAVAAAHSGTVKLSPTQQLRARQGYLVPDQAAYSRLKAAAQATKFAPPAQNLPRPTSTPLSHRSPAVTGGAGFVGLNNDGSGSPSDSTGAIGPSSYVELINSSLGIFDRSGTTLAQDSLNNLAGVGGGDSVFDPQVIFDSQQKRFFYVADDVGTDGNNYLAYGYSTNSTPTGAGSFCHYQVNFGTDTFPDYPKLGDTSNYAVIGANDFSNSSGDFLGADILALTKPSGTSSACTLPSIPAGGYVHGITGSDGGQAITSVPVNQTDPANKGYVVAEDANIYNTGSSSKLYLFSVSRNTSGKAVISRGATVTVPRYSFPANAPASGTPGLIDTLDARPTQAVSGIDSMGVGGVGVFTQQTVGGGAGSMVQWYEINPTKHNLRTRGDVADSTLYAYNASLSTDRAVWGNSKRFGSDSVLNFTASSPNDVPSIWFGSNVRHAGMSGFVIGDTSPSSYQDFTCGSVCRWGDYSGATPDPTPQNSGVSTPLVWATNMLGNGNTDPGAVGWGTDNFLLEP